jgi:hypothetical protein
MMHSTRTPAGDERLLSEAPATQALSAFRSLKAKVAALFDRRPRTNDQVVPGQEGYAWCDSSERQLHFDITTCRRTWLF